MVRISGDPPKTTSGLRAGVTMRLAADRDPWKAEAQNWENKCRRLTREAVSFSIKWNGFLGELDGILENGDVTYARKRIREEREWAIPPASSTVRVPRRCPSAGWISMKAPTRRRSACFRRRHCRPLSGSPAPDRNAITGVLRAHWIEVYASDIVDYGTKGQDAELDFFTCMALPDMRIAGIV